MFRKASLFKAISVIACVLLFSSAFFPLSSAHASAAANFTNNGAPTATAKASATNVLVLDIDLPDAWNGAANTGDTPLKTVTQVWQGDTLNAFTALGSAGGTGYKEDGTGGFQGTEPVVIDNDLDSVWTSAADTLIIDNSDATPSAGTTLYDMGATDYFMDSDLSGTYNNSEAWVLDDGDGVLTAGALNGTGTDDVLFDGPADIIVFQNEFCLENSGGDNDGDYSTGEAIIIDDGDNQPDSGDSVVTAGKADVTNLIMVDYMLYDNSGGDNEYDNGTDHIFQDVDQDGVYTSAVDTVVDCDGSGSNAAGSCAAHNDGDTLVATAGGDNLCTDSLASPTVVYIDGNADCTSGNGGSDVTLLDGGGGIASATTSVATAWAYDDSVANGSYDDGEDLYIEETNGQLTYSGSADVVLVNGSGTLSAGDGGAVLGMSSGEQEVVYLDSNHNGSYDNTEPLVYVGDGTTVADDSNLTTSHAFLSRASGSWSADIIDMLMTTTDLGYVDVNNNAVYDDGEPIIRDSGASDANLESTDTVELTGTTTLMTSFPNAYAKTDSTSDTTTDIWSEETANEHTYSSGADTDVYTTGGLSAGDALTNFGANDKYSGSAPIDSSETIVSDVGTNAGVVDRQDDQLIGLGVVNTGSAVNSTDIAAVKAWADGGNGTFDSGGGDDALLGTMTVNSGVNTEWRLGGLTQSIVGGGQEIFVSVDLSGTPTDTRTMQFALGMYNDAGADGVANSDNDRGMFVSSNNDGPTDTGVQNANTQTIDTTAPSITSATSTTGDGTYGPGSAINITVNFSENVTSGAGLAINLDNGATVNTGALTNQSSFSGTYTVSASGSGEDSSDLTISSITGTIQDQATNSTVNPTVPGGSNIADSKAIVIDNTAPTITSATSTTGDGTYGPSSGINITVNFSENITSAAGLAINLDNGATVNTGALTNQGSFSGTYTVGATGSGEDSSDLTITSITGNIQDQATNPNSTTNPTVPGGSNIADSKALVIDTTAPTITSATSTTGDGTYGPSSGINITVNFSENISSAAGLAITLDNGVVVPTGALTNQGSFSGTYTVGATGSGEDSSDLTISGIVGNIQDAVSNSTTNPTVPGGSNIADSKAIVVDTTAPTITGVLSRTQAGGVPTNPTNQWYFYTGDNLRFVVTSNEALAKAQACVQSITNDNSSDTCAAGDFTTGTLNTDYIQVTGSATTLEFNTPLASLSSSAVTNADGYAMNLVITDLAGNVTASTGAADSFAAILKVDPKVLYTGTPNINNATTTDWSTITDYSNATVVFNANDGSNDVGSITFTGIDLTAAGAASELATLGSNMTVDGDNGTGQTDVYINSAALTVLNHAATIMIRVGTATRPGLWITDDTGTIIGYIPNTGSGPFVVGGRTINNVTWNAVTQTLTFDTDGFSGFGADNTPPTVTDGNISVSTGSGTGNAYIVGDTVTVTWAATSEVGGNGDLASATADLSGWGGGAAVAMTDTTACGGTAGDGTYEACYTIVGTEGIDGAGVQATVTALDNVGNSSGAVTDSSTHVVDTIAPTIGTPGVVAINVDNNSNSIANTGDTVDYTDAIPGAADGDTITVDFSGLTGNAAATSAGNSHTVTTGALNGSTAFTETITDDAGNTVTGNTNAINVNNSAPGVLASTNVEPGSLIVSDWGTATVTFTTVSAVPANGKIQVVFPAGFDVSIAKNFQCSSMDGGFVTTVAGQTVTAARQNNGTSEPPGSQTCTMYDVRNPSTAGSTGTYTIRTTDSATNTLDEDAAVTADTMSTSGSGGSTPAPAGGGGGGGGYSPAPTTSASPATSTSETSTPTETTPMELASSEGDLSVVSERGFDFSDVPAPRLSTNSRGTFVSFGGEQVDTGFPATLSVEVGKDVDPNTLVIVKDGKEIRNFNVKDGVLTFKTNDVSDFAIRTTSAPYTVESFPDIDGDPEMDAIMELRKRGVVEGNPSPDGKRVFKPAANQNRAETAAFVVRAFNLKAAELKDGEQWFEPNIEYLENIEVLKKDLVDPANEENKVNFIAFLVKMLGYDIDNLPEGSTYFDDVSDPDVWYYDLVSFAVDLGIIDQTGGEFNPGDALTRSMGAGFTYRAIE